MTNVVSKFIFCTFCVKILRNDCLLKILSILAPWLVENKRSGPECSYFEDILKLVICVCAVY